MNQKLTPNEAVDTVLRCYDGVRLQGFTHDYAVGFCTRKFKLEANTVDNALAVRAERAAQ